jgi:short-subunit dehydrogenase
MLIEEGVTVWGTSRDPAKLSDRKGFRPVGLELSDRDSIERAWTEIEQASGGVDLLVNNAGSGSFGPLWTCSPDDWEQEIATLLLGPVRLSLLAFRGMAARRAGCIVNVTSMAVEMPIPFMSGYDAGKAGLSAFTDCFGLEAGDSGVFLVDFRPGDFRTGFNEAMHFHENAGPSDEQSARAWRRMEHLMEKAPRADLAARDLRRMLIRGRGGIVRSGSFFQTRVAPIFNRLVPNAVNRRARRRYFRVGK